MAHRPNKLLLTLSALGIAAGINAGEAQAQSAARYDSFAEFFSYAQAALANDLAAKVDFVRAYPASPAAQRVARQVARQIQAMAPGDRRSVMDDIAARGGLPSTVAEAARLAGVASAAVGPVGQVGPQPGLEVAQSFEQGVSGAYM